MRPCSARRLKFDGRFILQTQTDGPVSFLIVDFQAPDRLRAYARYDAARLKEGLDSGALLGKGHLAMTIDQGPDMSRYQGLVALDGGTLEDAAHEYFLRSEQIPTRVRLAVGEEWRGGEGERPRHRWRAGGMLLQFLPKAPERARQADLHPGDAPEGIVTHTVAEDDAWVEGQSLIGDRGGYRADRSGFVGRAAIVSAVSRARRARVRFPAVARAMLVLARGGILDAQELRARRPRRDGAGRQGGGDLRVLLVGLSVHAERSGRGGGKRCFTTAGSMVRDQSICSRARWPAFESR